MSYFSSLMQPGELGLHRLVEQGSFQTRYITADHGGLIYPVQDTGDRGEEVGFQYLGIFQEA
jgi:hypothetical protein